MNKHTSIPDINGSALDALLERAEASLEQRSADWNMLGPDDVDMETFNHVVRVWIQSGIAARHLQPLRRLVEAQHQDGGWGDTRDDRRSKTRVTAFASQMLLRCDLQLGGGEFREPVRRAVGFLLRTQRPDGSWDDFKWHYLDATSVATGTLLFAVKQPWAGPAETEALKRAIAFVMAEQRSDGLWSHKSRSSPVEITAHFLQKLIPYGGADRQVAAALEGLVKRQHPQGHWDHENIDSTCDAARALMVGAASLHDDLALQASGAIDRAMTWLLGVAASGSVGPRPGQRPSVLYTTDVIDTIWKYRQYGQGAGAILQNYR
jgi:hypothetical protein